MPLGAARFGLLGGVADLGKLELIETQTSTAGTTAFDFTDLGSYNVHFITYNNFTATSAETNVCLRFSNDGGSSYISTGYQYATQLARVGTFIEGKSTNSAFLGFGAQMNTSTNGSGYWYCYNLLDSSKYSFATQQCICNQNTVFSKFGSGVLPTAETHNALQVTLNTDSIVAGGVVSLYGIAES